MAGVRHAPVRLIAMGGTIAFDSGPHGAVPALDGEGLLGHLGIGAIDVQPIDLANISSIGLRDHHLISLARAVEGCAGDGYGAVVITHGTDTLEETAYFLALTVPRGRLPIILTGAMRHNGLGGADGPTNLRTALLATQTDGLADAGPVVIIGDEIHTARFVTKSHATRVAAFSSTGGPIGQVVEDEATLWYQPRYRDHVAAPKFDHLPRVPLLAMTVGAEPDIFNAMLDTHPDGVVIEGFGAGHVAPQLLESVDRATAHGVPVVIASRSGDGPTLSRTYAVPGTEIDLQQRGAIMAGALSAPKVRLRLAVALAAGISPGAAFPVA
jgi:L-asparaginase